MDKTSPEQQDRQCQIILHTLNSMGFYDKEQVLVLWQQWQKKPSQTTLSPSQFLTQVGVTPDSLQQVIQQLRQKATNLKVSTDSPNNAPEIHTANQKLAAELHRSGLIGAETLQVFLQKCNREKSNLGQTLVREHRLGMSELIQAIKRISNCRHEETLLAQVNVNVNENVNVNVNENKGEKNSSPLLEQKFPNYRLIRELARGGMGIVYLAQELSSERMVALKVLLAGDDANQTEIKRFFREARAIAQIDAPNIIPIYDMGKQGEYPYFTMKYIEGKTLEDLLKNSSKNPRPTIKILEKIARALAVAHEKGILHRDIKPANILVDADKEPYLADFGLVKVIDSNTQLTMTGTVMGTPFYMSPEQVNAERSLDHRSDIYSLGIILYQLLTGKLPFDANTLPALYEKILYEEPIPLKHIVKSINRDISLICTKAMDKLPSLRYQNAKELADDLQRYLNKEKVSARRVNVRKVAHQGQRYYQRNFFWLNLGGTLFFLTLFLWFGWQKIQDKNYLEQIEKRNQAGLRCAQAEELLLKKKYAAALELLRKTTTNFPQSAQAHLLLGRTHMELENNLEADREFAQARLKAPQSHETLYYSSLFFYKQKKSKEALTLIDRALQYKKDFSEGYRLRASIYREVGEEVKSSQDIAKANDLETKNLEEEIKQALALQNSENFTQALAIFDRILHHYPNSEVAYLQRSQILYGKGDIHQALADVSKALELNPKYEYHFLKGKWLEELGHTKKALFHFKEAYELTKKKKERELSQEKIAHLFLLQKEYKQAIVHYETLWASGVNSASLHLGLAQAFYHQKKYPDSAKHLKKTLSFPALPDISKAQAFYLLGKISQQKKDLETTLNYWHKAYNLAQDRIPSLLYELGQIHFEKENWLQAENFLSSSIVRNPHNYQSFRLLGDSYLKQSKYSQATDAYSKCIQLKPWVAENYQQRALSFRLMGQFQESQRDFLKTIELLPENFDKVVDFFANTQEETDLQRREFTHKISEELVYKFYQKIDIELFAISKRNLYQEYMQEFVVKEYPVWDKPKVTLFMKAIEENDSPSVLEIAKEGLLSAGAPVEIYEALQTEQKRKDLSPASQRRFQKTTQDIYNFYMLSAQKHFEQLIVSHYIAHNQDALKSIYEQRKHGLDVLEKIILTAKNPILRFLASQALLDLCTIEARAKLKKLLQSVEPMNRFWASIVLVRDDVSLSQESFLVAMQSKDPFVRQLVVSYIPEKHLDHIQPLLKDDDIRVQISAARRLWTKNHPLAKEILEKGFSHTEPSIRAFAYDSFWRSNKKLQEDKDLKEKYIQKYLPSLEIACEDPSPLVRRIVISILSDLYHPKIFPLLKKRLEEDTNPLVRLQTIFSLGLKGRTDILFETIIDTSQTFVFRLVPLFAAKTSSTLANVGVFQGLQLVQALTEDPEPRMRVMVLEYLAKRTKKGGLSFLLRYLESPDHYTRLGVMLGMKNATKETLPQLEKLLYDPSDQVRVATASTIVQVLLRNKVPNQAKYEAIIDSLPTLLKRGAAFSYARSVTDLGEMRDSLRSMEGWNLDEMRYLFIETMTSNIWKRASGSKSSSYLQRCLSVMDKAVSLDPDNAEYLLYSGVLHYLVEDYSRSEERIKKALTYQDDLMVYHLWLAQVRYARSSYKEALEGVEFILEKRPWNYPALELKAKILQKMDRQEELKIVSERLLHLKKNSY